MGECGNPPHGPTPSSCAGCSHAVHEMTGIQKSSEFVNELNCHDLQLEGEEHETSGKGTEHFPSGKGIEHSYFALSHTNCKIYELRTK